MKNYFTIFKLLFKYMFKRSGEKSSKWIWLAYAFIGLAFGCLIFFMCMGVRSVATVVASMGLLPEFLTVLLGIACIAAAYPLYVRITRKEREKLAPRILELTEELAGRGGTGRRIK